MSSYTGGEVSVCDSLSDGSLSDSLSVQLVELYRPAIQNGMLMVTLLPVQQQEGTQDCGLFCIANAYSVAMGKNPATLTITKVECGVTWRNVLRRRNYLCFHHHQCQCQ